MQDRLEATLLPGTKRAILTLLGQRYGDGLVYLRGGGDRITLERAIRLGLVNDDGYLTPRGHQFWRCHQR